MRLFKRTALGLGVLILLMVSYRVLGVYEFRSGECTATQPRRFANTYPKHLVVMSFNIEGHASLVSDGHIEEVAKTILKYQPDLVGINEAHRGTWQARFGDHITQLERLTGMRAAFGRSYRFLGGDFGNAVLTRGEIVAADVKALPGTGEPRTLLETVVRVNGGTIQFYVTHTAAWADINQALTTLGMDARGPAGQLVDDTWTYRFLRARANSIEGGTTEILKNIVAERVLGLPRA